MITGAAMRRLGETFAYAERLSVAVVGREIHQGVAGACRSAQRGLPARPGDARARGVRFITLAEALENRHPQAANAAASFWLCSRLRHPPYFQP